MTCLNQLEQIFQNKPGFTALIEQLEKKDFSRIEATDGGFMKKFLEREEVEEIKTNEILEITNEETIKQIINLEINVSNIKQLKINLDSQYLCEILCTKEFFIKLINPKKVDFGETKLHGINGIKDILVILFKNPNLIHINISFIELHKVDGIENLLPILFKNPNLKHLDLGFTNFNQINGFEKMLIILFINNNFNYLYLGAYTNFEDLQKKLPKNIRPFIEDNLYKNNLINIIGHLK